jgi:hypothetical protein
MRIAALALGTAVVLALAGCAPATHGTSSPTPKPTPVFSSDRAALAAAEKAYRIYRTVAEQILAHGGEDPAKINSVATGRLLSDELKGMTEFRKKHYHSVGASSLTSFSLESTRRGVSGDVKAAVTAYACLDVSAVDVLDSQGHSVVSATRPPKVSYEVTFDLVAKRLLPSDQEPWDSGGVCR